MGAAPGFNARAHTHTHTRARARILARYYRRVVAPALNANVVELGEGATHLVVMEQPEAVAKLILAAVTNASPASFTAQQEQHGLQH
jgi:hypothetical protein